ncbi:MAG TPA: HepT-like ribonuclease domain-containing protein [Steroidobacteraceae bacterium]|nr:HepT-like ribonuclease domain-containing protein [Steroidobacteraceae bacterium]
MTASFCMRREPAAFLWDVHEAALRIHEVLVQSAVERQFEIIGEALNQLSKVSPDIASRIPDCDQIIAFRNILIHGYAVLDIAIVWKVIQQHLPVMEEAVMRLLDAEPPPDVASTN